MRKLRVGIWINEGYKPEEGGGFGYYSQIINAAYSYTFKDAEITFIAKHFSSEWDKKDKSYKIQTADFKAPKLPFRYRVVNKIASILRIQTKPIDYSKEINTTNEILKTELSQVIDVIYYLIPGCIIENFPYIYTLWDVGHLSMYAFPEVTMNNCFEKRKAHHELYPYKAIKIFSESETGKKEVQKYLSMQEDRIDVIPLFPSEIVHDNCVSSLPLCMHETDYFIHYPAQFWAHKNHYGLVLAFKEVSAIYPNLKLVFTGTDKGNKSYIMQIIEELHLQEKVIDLGFIAIEELKWLYLNSQGLVMPTFLGPTNMPLLEAATLGCPVACSDLLGHREQLGDYGHYFNPQNTTSIVTSITEMIEDKANGIKKEYNSKFTIENALIQIDHSFSELKNIRFCWGTNDKIF